MTRANFARGRSGRSGLRYAVAAVLCLGLAGSAGAVAEAEPEGEAPEVEEVATPSAEPGRVARSAFTTAVVDREPTDTLSSLGNDVERVAYFTELHGFEGAEVVHRWMFGGEVVAEVPFQVGAPRWRVHSTKNLGASRLGEWSVSVVAGGEVITTEQLLYTEAAAEAAAPASLGEASE